jgi:hypothetical protein
MFWINKVWDDSPEGVIGRLKWPGGRSVWTKSMGELERARFLDGTEVELDVIMTYDGQRTKSKALGGDNMEEKLSDSGWIRRDKLKRLLQMGQQESLRTA